MKKGNKEELNYCRAIVLDYVNNKPHCCHAEEFQPIYFNEMFGISDLIFYVQNLAKDGLVYFDESKAVFLTEKGKEILNHDSDYIDFFRFQSPFIELKNFINERKANDYIFTKTMLKLLLSRVKKSYGKCNFTEIRDIHIEIASLYELDGKHREALYHYVTALYYETSGIEYYDMFVKYISGEATVGQLLSIYEYVHITPLIIKGIVNNKEAYGEGLVKQIYQDHPLSMRRCSRGIFTELLTDIMDNKYENKAWQLKLWDAYNKLINVADGFKAV